MRWIAVLLVAILALAGCGSDGSDGGADSGSGVDGGTGSGGGTGGMEDDSGGDGGGTGGSEGTGRDRPVELKLLVDYAFLDCSGFRFTHQADAAAVQALLPDGFNASTTSDPTGLSPARAMVTVDLVQCRNLTTPNLRLGSFWFGHVAALVDTPDAVYPDHDVAADRQEYTFQVFAETGGLDTFWPQAGYDTYAGTPSVNLTGDPTVAGVYSASLDDYRLNAVVVAADAGLPAEATHARYTVRTDGDRLLWTGTETLSGAAMGPGILSVPASSPLAGLGTQPGTLEGTAIVVSGDYTGMDLIRILATARTSA